MKQIFHIAALAVLFAATMILALGETDTLFGFILIKTAAVGTGFGCFSLWQKWSAQDKWLKAYAQYMAGEGDEI